MLAHPRLLDVLGVWPQGLRQIHAHQDGTVICHTDRLGCAHRDGTTTHSNNRLIGLAILPLDTVNIDTRMGRLYEEVGFYTMEQIGVSREVSSIIQRAWWPPLSQSILSLANVRKLIIENQAKPQTIDWRWLALVNSRNVMFQLVDGLWVSNFINYQSLWVTTVWHCTREPVRAHHIKNKLPLY